MDNIGVLFYLIVFFLFFNVKKYTHDITIYYSLMTITVLHWYSVSMISFLETKNYNIDIKNITTSNIPHISVIFGDSSRMVANILYLIGALNFIYITFFTKKTKQLV